MVDTGVDLGIRILTPDHGRSPERTVSSQLGTNISDFLQQIRHDSTKFAERSMARSFGDMARVPKNLESLFAGISKERQLSETEKQKYAALFIMQVCSAAPYTVGNTLESGLPGFKTALDVQKAKLHDFRGMVDTEYGMLLGCLAEGPGDDHQRIKNIKAVDRIIQEVVLGGAPLDELIEDDAAYKFYVDLDHAYGVYGAAYKRRENEEYFKDRTMTWIIETRSDKTDTRPVLTSKMSLNYLVRNYAPCIRGGMVFPDNRSRELAPFLRDDEGLIEAFAEAGIQLHRTQPGNDENGYDIGKNSLSFLRQGTTHFEYDNVEMGDVLTSYDFSYQGGGYHLVFADTADAKDGSALGTNICCYVETAKSNWGSGETATIFRRDGDKYEAEVVKLSQLMEVTMNSLGELLHIPSEYGKVKVLTDQIPPPHFS